MDRAKQPPMTLAERERVDQIIQAMTLEQQKRALMNIDPELIEDEKARRFKKLTAEINQFYETWNKYKYDEWNWIVLTKLENELKAIKFMK